MDQFQISFSDQLLMYVRSLGRDAQTAAAYAASNDWADALMAADEALGTVNRLRRAIRRAAMAVEA